jgi:hypothetical protein
LASLKYVLKRIIADIAQNLRKNKRTKSNKKRRAKNKYLALQKEFTTF